MSELRPCEAAGCTAEAIATFDGVHLCVDHAKGFPWILRRALTPEEIRERVSQDWARARGILFGRAEIQRQLEQAPTVDSQILVIEKMLLAQRASDAKEIKRAREDGRWAGRDEVIGERLH